MSFEGIEFEHISWAEEATGKRILENSPFAKVRIEAGNFVAVCGPTSSGKSALLHLLAGSNLSKERDKIRLAGSVNIITSGDMRVKRCNRCYFQHSALVPHIDYLISTLKCKESLEIRKALHGNDYSTTLLVDSFLEMIKLSAFSQDLVDTFNHKYDLSTRGNLKKLSILESMVSSPHILLVDEPAYLIDFKKLGDIFQALKHYSRLDNEQTWICKHCRMNLKLPSKNCVIFAFNSILLSLNNLTATSSFLKCVDKIILMSVSRQIVFFGTLEDAIETIGHGSLENLILALENLSFDKDRCEGEIREDKAKTCGLRLRKRNITNYKISSPRQQFNILMKRHLLQIRNAPKQLIRVILQRILIFIILSFIFAEPTSRASFIGIFFFIPINQTANVLLFTATEGFQPDELEIITKSRFKKLYKSWTILLAKVILLVCVNIIPALIYLPAVFFISAFGNTQTFYLFFLANILQIACTVPLGLCVGSSSKNPFFRDLWLFGVTTIVTTFGGIHTAANHDLTWILRWIQYLSPTYYLFLILIQLEYSQDEIMNTLNLGRFLLSIGEAFAALAALGIIYFLAACVLLNRTTKPSRILF